MHVPLRRDDALIPLQRPPLSKVEGLAVDVADRAARLGD